jgi:hypothetical protein
MERDVPPGASFGGAADENRSSPSPEERVSGQDAAEPDSPVGSTSAPACLEKAVVRAIRGLNDELSGGADVVTDAGDARSANWCAWRFLSLVSPPKAVCQLNVSRRSVIRRKRDLNEALQGLVLLLAVIVVGLVLSDIFHNL